MAITFKRDPITHHSSYGYSGIIRYDYYVDGQLVDESLYMEISGVVHSLNRTFSIISGTPVSLSMSVKIDDKNDLILEHNTGTFTVKVYRDVVLLYTINGSRDFVYEYCEGVIRDVLLKPAPLPFSYMVGSPKWEKEAGDMGTESVEERRKLGLCPQCGEKGPFVNFTMTCKEHGPY